MSSQAINVLGPSQSTATMGAILEDFKDFFNIREMPFSLLPNTQFYVALPSTQQCLSMMMFALSSAEGIIKVTGEVGVGKTLVCRCLLNSLDENEYCSAYIPNPSLNPVELKRSVAKELQVPDLSWLADDELMEAINKQLIRLALNDKKVVLVIDEAQALPEESIEALRLLTNLETESQKLMQIVLFAQPELDELLSRHSLRQLRQRITYSYIIEALNISQVDQFVSHRLAYSGYQGEAVFKRSAIRKLHKYSKGIPRLINIISGKAMLIAFSKGVNKVSASMVKRAAMDTEGVDKYSHWFFR
ncbi:AAA family ATPase [Oceaniserpentilla sp. 4NH20-0058]|uniref:ExeA family protein n=1 Tax=Oceaniserpentilla sp. 4NH20-0058 TaxID=3127660 RepID=UPI0031098FB3